MARPKGVRCEAFWDGQNLTVRRGGAVLHIQPAGSLLEALNELMDFQMAMEVTGWKTRRFVVFEEARRGRWAVWLYRR